MYLFFHNGNSDNLRHVRVACGSKWDILNDKFPNIDAFPACRKSLLSISYHNLCECTETYRFDELLYNLAKHIFLNIKSYKLGGTHTPI